MRDPGHRRCTDPTVHLCVRCALPWPCPTTRSAGGIDKADAARSEPSPVGDATTSVRPEPFDSEGRWRGEFIEWAKQRGKERAAALTAEESRAPECSNGPDSHALGLDCARPPTADSTEGAA